MMTAIWGITGAISALYGMVYLFMWGQGIGFAFLGDAVTYLIVGEWMVVMLALVCAGMVVTVIGDSLRGILFSTEDKSRLPLYRGIVGFVDLCLGAFLTWQWFLWMGRIQNLFSATNPIPDDLPLITGILMALAFLIYVIAVLFGGFDVVEKSGESE